MLSGVRIEIIELREGQNLEKEAEEIEKRLKGSVYILDPEGRMLTKSDIENFFSGHTTVVIGGKEGIHERLKSSFEKLSLSHLVFSHQLARIVLLEQIFRFHAARKGINY